MRKDHWWTSMFQSHIRLRWIGIDQFAYCFWIFVISIGENLCDRSKFINPHCREFAPRPTDPTFEDPDSSGFSPITGISTPFKRSAIFLNCKGIHSSSDAYPKAHSILCFKAHSTWAAFPTFKVIGILWGDDGRFPSILDLSPTPSKGSWDESLGFQIPLWKLRDYVSVPSFLYRSVRFCSGVSAEQGPAMINGVVIPRPQSLIVCVDFIDWAFK